MARYLDPDVYHAEFVSCIKAGKLSNKMIEMFTKHAYNVCRRFFIPQKDDKDDAVASCLRDFCLYWKNFMIENCLQIKFASEFLPGDQFIISIANFEDIVCTAGHELNYDTMTFKIEDTINRTIRSMMKLCQQEKYQNVIKVSNHSVNFKFSVADLYNGKDLSVFSKFIVKPVKVEGRPDLIMPDKYYHKLDENVYSFIPAPKAFLFCTSVCNNSIRKSLSYTNPKEYRNGNRVRLSLNADNNGIYTL